MKIGEIMTSNPVSVNPDNSMLEATRMLKENGFKHLPVTNGEGKNLVGVITDRDLKRASASNATTLEIHELLYLLDQVKIGDIMTRSPVTVTPGDSVESAAKLMLKRRIGCLPVLRDNRLTGIVTKGDMLKLVAKC